MTTPILDLHRRPSVDESFAAAMLDPMGTTPVCMEMVEEFIATQKVPIATHRLVDKATIERRHDGYDPMDELRHAFQYDLETYMIGIRDHKIEEVVFWPKDWWQMLKEQYAPKWFLKRWPVEYDDHTLSVQAYKAVCPHLAGDDDECRGFLVREYRE
jgi:hypothetical protein